MGQLTCRSQSCVSVLATKSGSLCSDFNFRWIFVQSMKTIHFWKPYRISNQKKTFPFAPVVYSRHLGFYKMAFLVFILSTKILQNYIVNLTNSLNSLFLSPSDYKLGSVKTQNSNEISISQLLNAHNNFNNNESQ